MNPLTVTHVTAALAQGVTAPAQGQNGAHAVNKSQPPIRLSQPPSRSMAALTMIDIQDARMLVVPSPRRIPTAKEMAAFVSRLAPIEMAAPSLSQPSQSLLPVSRPEAKQVQAPAPSQPGVCIQGWTIPLAYVACGVTLCLCNILVPDGIVGCVHVLCPVWTLTLAAHALATSDPAWLWMGALTGLLLPFVLLLRDVLFVCFYLLVFAAFATGRFWQTLQGPPLVLACVSWAGLLSGCTLAVLAEHPRAQVSVATFFGLSAAMVSSAARFGKVVLRVA